jgi:hypothetical protein
VRKGAAAAAVEETGAAEPCPVRPGDLCTRCVPGVTGPSDCGLVWLMGHSPDLHVESSVDRR